MAATGFTPIQLYRTSTAAAVPTSGNLADGELAINTLDEKLYFKNSAGTVKLLASTAGAAGDVVGPASATNNALVAFDGTTGKLIKNASLTANNVLLGNGTGAPQVVAPGTSGNVLTSNGTTWTSAAAGASLSGVTQSVSPFETALGHQAGNVTTGVNNTWVGYQAGLVNAAGFDNTALGYRALVANTTGNNNVAVGSQALDTNTSGAANTAVGLNALTANTVGNSNTAVGQNALNSTVTGGNNTAVGASALSANTAESSTAVGLGALASATSGGFNVAVGEYAGLSVTTGFSNVLIGTHAARFVLTTGTNNIVIGSSAAPSSDTVDNEVTLGNTSIVRTRLRGMVELNAAMFEQAALSATAATGTIDFNASTRSVLYYTSNASNNWTLNIIASPSLNGAMTTGQSLTVAFLVTNGATAYRQTGLQVDGTSVTPRWQGGTAPTAGNANSVDAYVITIIKTGSATFTAFASQTRFA